MIFDQLRTGFPAKKKFHIRWFIASITYELVWSGVIVQFASRPTSNQVTHSSNQDVEGIS
nr:hypothetical protein [Cressdnaviricota sp.]